MYYRTGRSKVKRSVNHVGVIKALSVNTSTQSLEITSLEPFTSYDVWVSAFTDVGSGPPSRPVTVITDEDGEYHATFFYAIDVWILWLTCLLRRRSFGSSRNLFSPTGKDCVTSQKNVCIGGYIGKPDKHISRY